MWQNEIFGKTWPGKGSEWKKNYSFSLQRCIQNPVKHLRLSALQNCFHKELYRGCLTRLTKLLLLFYFSLNIDVGGHVWVLSWSCDLSWRERSTTGRTTHGWQVKGEKPDKCSEEYYDRRQQLVLVAPIIIVDRPGTVNTDGYLDHWSTVMCKVHWEFTRFHWKSWFEVKV